ncbi:dual specificity protein phosphatase 18 isoform X2 [Bombina bombina]|nr:dual specificity protein phosphatase 18 isoform X2 [Bombina bombina]XP_053556472.1 dual specificity protein phosphatase 18 isoform X2 [Bombina bombina]XP_053556473.1 dual specificity protein phosphatase 18 isoform X2 [Bombina bombina]XP_053556474.1 dual specificity protein phosphatase 18 isoform X2 [Bombina bombina]
MVASEITFSKSRTMALSGVAKITDGLYLSNAFAANNKAVLTAYGITCVINVSLEKSRNVSPEREYLHFPVTDTPSSFLFEYFDTVADKIHSVEASGGRTLVHCSAGISRSPTLCLAYLMKYKNQSLLVAHNWLKTCRPIIRPNNGFWEQLIRYETKLFGNNTIRMVISPIGPVPNIYLEETKNMITFWNTKM